MMAAMTFPTCTIRSDDKLVVRARDATKAHADRTRGKSVHQEVSSESCRFVATLAVLHDQGGHDEHNAINSWLFSHLPMSRAIAESAKSCRGEQMHKRFSVKLDAQDAQLEGCTNISLNREVLYCCVGKHPREGWSEKKISSNRSTVTYLTRCHESLRHDAQ